jgi:tripartite-type tricarboxylate transporter receptor subunit TctC
MKRNLARITLAIFSFMPAAAHAYPEKVVRLIVPFEPGGTVDVLARMLAQSWTASLKHPVIVENRPGAAGNIATELVARAAADGHTILLTTNRHAISPALYRRLPFDAEKDFAPVSQLTSAVLLLVASPKLPVGSVKDLVSMAKAKPGSLNYASTGAGGPLQLAMELLKLRAGVNIVEVPYKGDAPAIAALIAGDVHVAVVPMPTALAHIQAGRLRALGVTRASRTPALPDVPTVAEQGVDGFDVAGWHGLFAPAKTPEEVVRMIQRLASASLGAPATKGLLTKLGADPLGTTPDAFARKVSSDIAEYTRLVKSLGLPLLD